MTVSSGGARSTVACAAVMACVCAGTAAYGLAATSARAQEAETAGGDEVALDPISAIGQFLSGGWLGASDHVYDTPGSVAEIGRQEIENRGGARNTADLFRGVAGVDAVIDRQNPGLNVNIRGLQDQGRVNMSVDGARQNFQQSGHGATAFAYIDPELISRVEIDKGPTSTAGGAGVIGGVVNFRTLEFEDVAFPDKQGGVRLNATTGTNAYDFNGSLAAAGKVSDAFEVVAALSHKELGEYEAGKRGKLLYSGEGEPAEFTTQDQWSWLLKAKAEINDQNTVKLTYTGLDGKFGTGSGDFIDRNKIETHTVVGDWTFKPDSPWVDLAVKTYYTRTANEQFRPDRNPDSTSGTDAFNVDYAIDTFGGSITNVSRFSLSVFDVALTYGGEVFHDKTDTASVSSDPNDDPTGSQFSGSNPVGERTVGGVFSRAEFSYGEWLKILGGVRYDRFAMNGSGVVFDGETTGCGTFRCASPFKVDTEGGRFSPTATVAVTPLKGVQVYGSYEQGYRPPNIMESILGGEHIGGFTGADFAPNPNLKPEVSRTLEAGVNVKFDGVMREDDAFRAKVSIYRTKVDNFITQALVNGQGSVRYFFQNVNLSEATRLRGLDLEANYDAGFAYIGGSAAFIDARYIDRFENRPPQDVPALLSIYLSPKRKLSLDGGVRFFDRKVTVGGRMTHLKPDTTLGSFGGLEYRRYTLLDAYASWKIDENFTVRASVENIRDVAYVEAMGAQLSPSPGRTFTVGATARF